MESVAHTGRPARWSGVRDRLRDDSGFTLIEVLSAQLIGGFVIAAAITMLVIAFNSSARVTDRVNSAAQGRIAMEEIQQRLRSQTCLYSTEYLVNGATQSTSAAISFLHASPSNIAFFSDVGNTGGSSAATGSVGFSPQIRYLQVDPGPTTGITAGRKAKFVEGLRPPTTTTIPFVFSVTPLSALSGMATPAGLTTAGPTTKRAFADGITNEVTGSTTIPIFRYYDDAGVLIAASDATPVPAAQLEDIAEVEVNFRVLGLSGKDQANPGATTPVDRRTASFSNSIHLHTAQSACS